MELSRAAGRALPVFGFGLQGQYFYEPEGGRDVSQSLVGVGSDETKVKAEESFTFSEDIEMGLRIHKTSTVTGHPISEITFTAYKVPEGGTISETPTTTEIEQYAVEGNRAGSVTTDTAGYAALELEKGTYLIVEERNADKVQEPVWPFYIVLPMPSQAGGESVETGAEAVAESGGEPAGDDSIEVEYLNVVSVYPKNTPVEPPEDEPVIPNPPSNVTGGFSILKHDAADPDTVLAGAEFALYRPATAEDTNTEIVVCDGVKYTVVPMNVTLTTDANGYASHSDLTCGVYFLVETKAPKGYNRLKEAVAVNVVSSELAQTSISIPNTRGTLLPETDGTGVTWFLLGGGMLTLSAVVLLVTRRRMGRYE